MTPDFRLLFECAPGQFLVLSADFTIVAASDAYLRATMVQREAIVGRGLFDVFPDNPDDADATGVGNLRASLQRVLQHRVPDAMAVQKYDIRRPESAGGGFEVRYWSPLNVPVLDPEGGVGFIIHRVEDVTDLMRLKFEGLEQDKLAQALRTRAGQMEGEIYRRAQQLQQANQQLRLTQEALRRSNAQLERRVEERTTESSLATEALKLEARERQRTELTLSRTEEQLRQAQKMEAVGRLAGGVAHDFNNLLSVVLGYSATLISDLRPGDPMRDDLREIELAGERAAALTRQLLAFSRQQVLEPRIVDLNSVVITIDKMLRRVIGEDIEVVTRLSGDLGAVKVDPGQMEQVLMNLVVNARDAMPDGGQLVLETSNVDVDPSSQVGGQAGPHVMIAVTDTGIGMDRATQARIFEPFFTTKEAGKGTGLGLSTVFGIVKQSGGAVWVYSEVGHGTTFKVYLPRVVEPASPAVVPVVRPAPGRGSETILLVEDEPQVRTLLSRVLRSAGYRVLEAENGGAALMVSEQHPESIDLLLTDVVMPRMSGRQLAERLLPQRSNLQVLYMSGYTDDAVVRTGVLESGMPFLQKPITPEALVSKVQLVLGTSGSLG